MSAPLNFYKFNLHKAPTNRPAIVSGAPLVVMEITRAGKVQYLATDETVNDDGSASYMTMSPHKPEEVVAHVIGFQVGCVFLPYIQPG